MILKFECILWTIAAVSIHFYFAKCSTSKLYKLIYEDFDPDNFDRCVRLMNGTHQVGCQSSEQGNIGVLYHINTTKRIEQFLFVSTHKRLNYVVLVDGKYFNKNLINKFIGKTNVVGVIVYQPDKYIPPEWSPDLRCPSGRINLYNQTYGPSFQTCKHKWNPRGDGLTEQDIPFPIFNINKDEDRNELLNCYYRHNVPEEFPLCSVQMKSYMFGAVDSITCLRRSILQSTMNPVRYCETMGGLNLVSSLKTYANQTPNVDNSVILVTAPLDSRSLMSSSYAPGASEATGFISMLAVAHALGSLSKAIKDALQKDVVFVLFDGEAFDNIGSMRMVYDMKNGNFPVAKNRARKTPPPLTLDHVSHVIELRQLGHSNGSAYVHYDQVSYIADPGVRQSIDDVITRLGNYSQSSFTRQSPALGLIPSSLHSLLKEKKLAGVVLSDYDSHFNNKGRYFSRYDTLENMNVDYKEGSSDQQVREALKGLAQVLTRLSTGIAKTIYHLASDGPAPGNLQVDTNIVTDLLFCYLYKSNCSLFRENLGFYAYDKLVKHLGNSTLDRYVSVYRYTEVLLITNMTKGLLANFVGNPVQNSTQCAPQKSQDDTVHYYYLKGKDGNPLCVASSTYQTPAVSPYLLSSHNKLYANFPGMWTESQWSTDAFRLRMFLVQDSAIQGMILVAGVVVAFASFLWVYFMKMKSDIIFLPQSDL